MAEEQSATPSWRYQAAVAIGGVVLVAAGLLAYFMLGSSGEGEGDDASGGDLGMIDTQRPEEGEQAPDFALVDARDGETVRRLSDYEGTPMVLNWYASWCGPCRAEIPHFQEAQDALGDDVAFLLVNLEQSQEEAAGFLEDVDTTLPSVLDSEGEVAQHYRVSGMPTTYFIDAEGEVTVSGRGIVTEEALRTELANLGLEY